jgi:hypothetical protein
MLHHDNRVDYNQNSPLTCILAPGDKISRNSYCRQATPTIMLQCDIFSKVVLIHASGGDFVQIAGG